MRIIIKITFTPLEEKYSHTAQKGKNYAKEPVGSAHAQHGLLSPFDGRPPGMTAHALGRVL